MAIDKTKNAQVLITLSKEMIEKIEDFQFENRIKSRSEAMRRLIEKGLQQS